MLNYIIENESTSEQKVHAVEGAVDKEDLGYLVQICTGKQHTVYLTADGCVYIKGTGLYGTSGKGGAVKCSKIELLKPLSEKKVIQIACGEYHTLAITQSMNIYSWGRRFEGQLGIAVEDKIEAVSKPTFIPFFNKIEVKYIAAGHYSSFCISQEGDLYGWGEARLGQLGCGKQSLVFTPQKINLRNDKTQGNPFGECKDFRVKKIASGFSHTAAITEDNSLFAWGLNALGQIGVNEKNIVWWPVQVEKDVNNEWLHKVKDVVCGHSFTFIIDGILSLYP